MRLSDDEHRARAMLLGRFYDPHIQGYRSKTIGSDVLDCVTLEVLPEEEFWQRFWRWMNSDEFKAQQAAKIAANRMEKETR